MNANNDATAATTHQAAGRAAPAQDIRRRLQSIIDAKDWTGITNIIQKQQEEQQHGQLQLQHTVDDTNATTSTTSSTPNGTLLEEVVNILTSKDRLPYTLLQEKNSESAKELLSMLVALGGHDYVMRGDFYLGEKFRDNIYGTILHVAVRYNSCKEVLLKIIEAGGGRDIVCKKDTWDCTALHCACEFSASIDVVKLLIEVGGGRDYVWDKDYFGLTALPVACANNASIDVVKIFIEVEGGRDFVFG